jgi:hypothetical protein
LDGCLIVFDTVHEPVGGEDAEHLLFCAESGLRKIGDCEGSYEGLRGVRGLIIAKGSFEGRRT